MISFDTQVDKTGSCMAILIFNKNLFLIVAYLIMPNPIILSEHDAM